MKAYKSKHYENRNYQKEQAYLRAKKRVKDIKGFYWHAFWYIVVNIFIISAIGIYQYDGLLHFSTFYTAFFWGIGLGFHALGVFGKNLIFSKNWENRKIKAFMDNDKTNQKWE